MPWNRPSLKQLYERIARDFSGRLQEGGSLIATSVEAVLSKVWAGAAHLMHGFLAWAFLQVFADTAEGVYMERWARIWAVYRKEDAAARGPASFPASAGCAIEAGAVVLHQLSGQRYLVEATSREDAGILTVTLVAAENGSTGNLEPGSEVQLVSPVPGVNSKGTVTGEGLTGGVEEEQDDSLRSRLIARLRQPPRGGAKHDYEAWALEVPGVTRAWCYPMGNGIGTVTLTFVTDDAPTETGGPIPTPEMVSRVQAHIDAVRPATVKEFEAFAPEVLAVAVKLSVTPDTAAVRAAVLDALADLFAREGEPGTTLYRSHINESVSLAAGEIDHTLYLPKADVVTPTGYFPLLGAIEFVEVL